jgi:eukaryotic-like serine/threonine-protein kinase
VVEIAAVVAGKYRIDRILGQGGMGIVVKATHLELHQPVAIKFLLPDVLGDPLVKQRFLREGRAAVRLRSEHVARVLDVGTLENGAPYMVLEYLEGTDLASVPRARLTIGLIVDLTLQACEALAEAHAMGIVHRDIKPANFFLTRRSDGSELIKILDFGISKAPATLEGNLTATKTVIGTPTYMSPEQMRSSRNVDHRSDIWSLGVVLYELTQGAPPFEAETFSGLVFQVATEPVPPLAVRIPKRLADIVYKCLEKDPGRRFQNVAELAHALAPHARSTAQAAISIERTTGVLARGPRLQSDPALPTTIVMSPAVSMARPAGSAQRWPYVAGSLTVLAAIVAVVIVASSGEDPRDEHVTHSPGSAPATKPEGPSELPRPPVVSAPPPAPPADAAVVIAPPDVTPEAVSTPKPPPPKQPKLDGARPPSPTGSDSDDILGTRN